MSKARPGNVAASVRQRLLNLAKSQNEDFQLVLTRYGLERFLYRLSRSPHRDVFVLKGAMLFQLWTHQPHRPTRDLDLLGHGENSVGRFAAIFREICQLPVGDDGLAFRADSVRGDAIKEDQEYSGLRFTLDCRLENARIPIQIDIGFGDVVTPAATEVTYPPLLDFPPPVLPAYPMESVVAEKFQAMVMLGIANSRMKDFFDIWIIARGFAFDGPQLSKALAATFQRRQTPVPAEPPLALLPEFTADRGKQAQWRAFVAKGKLDVAGADLGVIATVLDGFLMPPARAVAAGKQFEMTWHACGPWKRR